MTAPMVILLVTAAVVVVQSGLVMARAYVDGDRQARTRPLAYFAGAILTTTALAFVIEGAIFGIVRLIRYAWGGP